MPEALLELLDELAAREGNEKLKFLLELAQELPNFPEAQKRAVNKISGCASNAYLVSEFRNGQIFFQGDSDAQIPKGILAFLILGINGASPEEVLSLSPALLDRAGIAHLLSPSRANGASQIFQRIQSEAQKFLNS